MTIGPKTTLTLERYATPTSDGQGGATVAWYSVRDITGSLLTVNARELYYAGKVSTESTNIFYIDNPVGLTLSNKDRFRKLTRVFEIEEIKDPTQQCRWLRVFLKEIV